MVASHKGVSQNLEVFGGLNHEYTVLVRCLFKIRVARECVGMASQFEFDVRQSVHNAVSALAFD